MQPRTHTDARVKGELSRLKSETQNDTMHRPKQRHTKSEVFTKRQTDTTKRPDHANAVWRMARLESRRRARQAAKPPRVGACSLRTGDASMGLPTVPLRSHGAPLWEREPPERKHLSRGRKRNQHGIPLLAASETGKVQTESHAERHGRCRV